MLLADMLHSIIREITALSTHNNENVRGAAIVNVVLFGLICLLIFPLVNIVLFLLYIYAEDKSKYDNYAVVLCRRIIIATIQTLGAILYFYGDNIGYITQNYSEELGCGDQCILNNQIAAIMTLGLALIILHFFPITFTQLDVIINDGCSKSNWNDKTSKWNYGLNMITIIVKIDIVYTAVAIMTQTDEFCGHIDVALSGTFIALCMVVGVAFIFLGFLYTLTKIDKDYALIITVVSFILLVPSLCMYLLADNQQPLDCGFNCDTLAANQTLNEISCSAQINNGVRLLFMLLCLGFVAPLSFIWICTGMWSKKTEEEVIDGPENNIELEDKTK